MHTKGERRFGARAHLSPVYCSDFFLNMKMLRKILQKIEHEHIQVLDSRVNFRQKISIFAPCAKKTNLSFCGLFTYFVCQIFVFFAQVTKFDIFCRKFTRVLDT